MAGPDGERSAGGVVAWAVVSAKVTTGELDELHIKQSGRTRCRNWAFMGARKL